MPTPARREISAIEPSASGSANAARAAARTFSRLRSAAARLAGGCLTFRGTRSGEFLGVPATGRNVEDVSREFLRIADGLIAEGWVCSDTATVMRQIS